MTAGSGQEQALAAGPYTFTAQRFTFTYTFTYTYTFTFTNKPRIVYTCTEAAPSPNRPPGLTLRALLFKFLH